MATRHAPIPAAPQAGFTLIELMITIVVLSILVSIAVPTYTSQIRKSRRTDARTAVLDLAGREERFFSVQNRYTQDALDVGYDTVSKPLTNLSIGGGYYLLTVTVPDPAPPVIPNSYLITAASTGAQVSDAQCTSFSVNQLGAQTAVGSGGATASADCWR